MNSDEDAHIARLLVVALKRASVYVYDETGNGPKLTNLDCSIMAEYLISQGWPSVRPEGKD